MKIYLAGPSVFYSNSDEISESLKSYCHEYGFTPLYPMDNVCVGNSPEELAKNIAISNIEMIQEADAIIADISCFRGTAMDVGTAFEIGMAVQRGIPVVAYTDSPRPSYADRVSDSEYKATFNLDGLLVDKDGHNVEDFGLQENLMISAMVDAYTDEGARKAIEMVHRILYRQENVNE